MPTPTSDQDRFEPSDAAEVLAALRRDVERLIDAAVRAGLSRDDGARSRALARRATTIAGLHAIEDRLRAWLLRRRDERLARGG